MQPHLNNDLRKLPNERGKGIAGAVIIHFVLFAILILVAFSAPKPPETENGILVNFGTDETGLGMIEPSLPASQEESSAVQPVTETPPTKEDAIVTQSFDKEAPEVKKVDPEGEKKRKEQIEAQKIRRAEIEAENIKKAQAEAERRRIEAEEKRVSDIVNRTKNALSNSRNAGTNTTSEGITGGQGNQGVPTGSVDSKVRGTGTGTGDSGISYYLQGRGFQDLPPPKYDYQEEGKVVVKVIVDRFGKVTEATAGVRGSTVLDEYLISVAKEAALKAKFEPKSDAPLKQEGTITYIFKLK